MTEYLNKLHYELKEMAGKEAIKVWRMGHRAKAKGCSPELVKEIMDEGWDLYSTYSTYPERLLDFRTKYRLRYAFCGERRR